MTEKEIVENLLKPRIKMIAPVPEYGMKVGTIITEDDKLYFELRPGYKMNLKGIQQYPHIYKELPWYEDRQESEMPGYVKNGESVLRVFKHYQRVTYSIPEFNVDQGYFLIDKDVDCRYQNYLPATKEEYIEYQNLQPKQVKG